MAAENNLGDQFEVIHPHQLIRVGDRHYPAVFTSSPEHEPEGHKNAIIPTENGGLFSVSTFAGQNRAEISAPQYSHTAPEDRAKVSNHDLFTPVGSAHGVEDFHSSMRALSQHGLDETGIKNNQRLMGTLHDLFNDRR